MVAPFLPDAEKLAAVREELPATAAGIYLDTATAGPIPREAARAMAELVDWEVRTGRADEASAEEAEVRADEARATLAAILGTTTDAIALTHGLADGLNVAAWSVDWRAGRRTGDRASGRAVATSMETVAALGPLWSLRERLGVELAIAPIGDGSDDAATLAALDRAIVPGTRLVVVSHVTAATGTVLPVARIAELAHGRGALVAVDGGLAAGALPIDVESLGADFYAAPASAWLLGPAAMGVLACSASALQHARPAAVAPASFAVFTTDPPDGGTRDDTGALPSPGAPGHRNGWPGSRPGPSARLRAEARRFEGSEFYRPSIVGMARSASWLAMYVGLDWAYERTSRQARRARGLLAGVRGVTILTPADSMAGVVTFRIGGWPAADAAAELSRRVFAITHVVAGLDALRISAAFFTTDDELATFCDAVTLLAGHAAETLPPRRTLQMLGEAGP